MHRKYLVLSEAFKKHIHQLDQFYFYSENAGVGGCAESGATGAMSGGLLGGFSAQS